MGERGPPRKAGPTGERRIADLKVGQYIRSGEEERRETERRKERRRAEHREELKWRFIPRTPRDRVELAVRKAEEKSGFALGLGRVFG
jgi:hypothetical protein